MTRRGKLEYAPPASHAWTVIAHAHVVSIVPSTTPPELVAKLWSAATTASVSLESYVAAIPLFGRDAVESFAVVLIEDVRPGAGRPEARIEVVLRGGGVVLLETPDGRRTIDARSSQPWYLGEFEDVTSFSLAGMALDEADVDDAGDSVLPLLSGVVPAAWARWTPYVPVSSETGELDDTVLGLGTGRREAPAAVPADTAPPTRADDAEHEDDPFDDTVLGVRAASATPADPGRIDTVAGDTVLTPRRRDARRERQGADDAAGLDDTILSARQRSAEHPAPPLDAGERHDRAPLYAFRVGVGETYGLERPAYLGRKPSAPRIVTGVSPQLVSVGSPRQEVSSTHLEIRQEGTTVVVTDLRSTNGTIVSAPGSDRLTLRQGQSVVVAPGTRIDIGDGNVVEILSAR